MVVATSGIDARGRRVRAPLVLCVLLALGLLAALPGRAAADGAQTVTFANTGDCTDYFQYFTVPQDVNWLTVTAWGGSGGHNKHSGSGGLGGWIKAPIPVTPGEQLAINVGAWGDAHGGCGWAAGGNRGYAEGGDLLGRDGFGGGSASAVFRYLGPGNLVPLLVAGGGGGGGGNGSHGGGDGGAGGVTPAKGESGHGTWGGGGGCGGCRAQTDGTSGGDEHAGAGGGGGGGGGGYPYAGAGGDGGGEGGGGGGGAGSSWAGTAIAATKGTSDRACPYPDGGATCDGLVTISWDTNPARVATSGGDNQQTPVGSVFAQRLSATVYNAEGFPVDGQQVTFTLPEGGASGTFTGGGRTAAATTNADGVAVSPILEADGVAGSWRVTASAASAQPATFTLTNTRAATVTHVASQANPSVAGQPVAFTAQVATTTTPFANWRGTVQFLVDGRALGTPVPVSSDGTAQSPAVRLGVGGWRIGDVTVTADYSGDANHAPSRSAPLTQRVLPAATATQVTTAPSPSTTGQRVTVTARVTAQAASQATPDGTVDFLIAPQPGEDPVAFATGVALGPDGTAQAETGTLSLDGAYAVAVRYDGDADGTFRPSGGSAVQNVGPDATATLVTSSVNPSVFGEPFELTATVARTGPGTAPEGTVTFTAGRLQLCGPTPVSAQAGAEAATATCAVAGGLAAKPNPITVQYVDPDGGFEPSTGALTQQIVSAASATRVTATPAQGTYGGTVRLRARVTPVAPGAGLPRGTVQFYVDDLAVGLPVEVVDGVAESDPVGRLTVGAHRLAASFEDDSDPLSLLPSTGALTYHVARAPTTLAITSDANPSPAAQPVVLTAHAASVGDTGPVAGDVQFLVDGAAVGGPVPMRNGVARSQPLAHLAAGAHTVVAELHGGTRFAPATATFAQRVDPAPPAPPPPPAPPRIPGPPPAEPKATATIETGRVDASAQGVVNIVLACSGPSGARCGGSLALASATRLPTRLLTGRGGGWRRASATLGRTAYTVPVGELRAVRVALSRAGRRVLSGRGGVRLTASATQRSGAPTARRAVRVLAVRAPALRIETGATTLQADGRIGLRARCGEAWARCAGTLTIARVSDGQVLGRARVAVPGGPSRTVSVRLEEPARHAIAAAGWLRVRALAVTTLPVGRATKAQRELTVNAPPAIELLAGSREEAG